MAKNLVIVESPTKAKTIKKYLGAGYEVLASNGHIMDLPKNKLGVDVDNDFEPQYVVIRGKAKILKDLKAGAKKAQHIYLAPDPDREGEAIAFHLASHLGDGTEGRIQRLAFYEITKPAILKALESPRAIDQNKVDAQQARRVLDRLVGYQVSPFLWSTIRYGLSAGRVQSVALRLICEREEEINAFVREEYWSVHAELSAPGSDVRFKAKLLRKDGEKLHLSNEAQAREVEAALGGRTEGETHHLLPNHPKFVVREVKKQEKRRQPTPPFITSTLQQEAFRRVHFSSQRTMVLAQQLYEGIELGSEGSVGLITYMRTDSTRVADTAMTELRDHIKSQFGDAYLPAKPNTYPVKASAQGAHEAIRPTSVAYTPERIKSFLNAEQFKLYQLIWRRFVASQMTPAVYDQTSADIEAGPYTLRATGTVLKFDGFTHVYADMDAAGEAVKEDRAVLPPLEPSMDLTVYAVLPEQHFTEPPPRYSEASLIRALEENGIGRPSTYATIVGTIATRDYVNRDRGKLIPTELGMTVFRLLLKILPGIFDVGFTAHMEEELDKVEAGTDQWKRVVREFYEPFQKQMGEAEKNKEELKGEVSQVSQEVCERCGRNLIMKYGRHGPFLACPGYPECKFTKPLRAEEAPVQTDEICPTCGANLMIRRGRFGRFMACSKYPDCKFTKPLSTGVKCPECKEGDVTERRSKRGRTFFGCNRYPECKFASWDRPVAIACEVCQNPFLVEKETQAKGRFYRCPKCKAEIAPEEVEAKAGA